MKPYAFLGAFLLIVGLIVIYSTLKGSGKAGMEKVTAELTNIKTNASGKFLYSEYTFTYRGKSKTAVCANKTKNTVGASETMYYDVTKDILSTEKAHRQQLIIGGVCIAAGILIFYFQSTITDLLG